MRGQRKNPRKAVQPFENKKRKIDIFKNYEANGVEKIQRKLEIFSTLISKNPGKDLDFGRQHNLTLDFSQPPYYAVKTQPGIQVTLGGIDVNNNMQVIKKDGGFSQIFTQPEKLLMTDHLDRDRRQSDFIKVILRHKTSLENLTDS